MKEKDNENICEEQIFELLYNKYSEDLHNYLYYKYGECLNPNDKVQEAFIKLWNNCKRTTLGTAKSFLFTVANNLFIDDYRKRQTRLKLKLIPRSDSMTIDGQYTMEMKEFGEQLEEAINSMSPASKEVFILHRFNEMSYKEMAQLLDISVKAIEKRMSKALKHLSDKMIPLKR